MTSNTPITLAYDGVEQDLRGEDRGGAGVVVVGGDLDKVDADDVALFGQAVDQFEDLVVEEPAVRGGAGAGGDGGVEAVDVDGQVVVDALCARG